MGLLLLQQLCRGAKADELLQDIPAPRVPDAGGQLAVRKGPRSPLSKLDITFLLQRATGEEGFHRLYPLLHSLAPLQNKGTIALPGQQKTTEHPRRSKTCNHWAVLHGGCPRNRGDWGGLGTEAHLLPERWLHSLLQLQGDGIQKADSVLPPGIHRAFGCIKALHLLPAQPRLAQRPLPAFLLILQKAHRNIAYQNRHANLLKS